MANQEGAGLAWEDREILEWAVAYSKKKVELEEPVSFQERQDVVVTTCRTSFYAGLYCGFIMFAKTGSEMAESIKWEPWTKQFFIDSGLGTLEALRALKAALEPQGQQKLI